ncbi:Putative N-acetylglutamate synthase, fungal, acetylglutamate kinase-like superfamily [Septoria linicola]|uniref:Amino-acid acetyltransferase, mitochondrial n=1 Tax=Septoria linicola TaxID=215465 RepID=A0A9Q9AY46_9PEZI|nr:Putative N-acetylglutamate synthase, fungal, acetylglutamate kinase-like superfamily [Septoria linicola]
MTTSMSACGKASAFGGLKKLTVRQCGRAYSNSAPPPPTLNGKHAARSEDPAKQRELLVNVLNASATRRDAKQYLARFKQSARTTAYLGPSISAQQEETQALLQKYQERLDHNGVNLGGLYTPARAIANSPQFSPQDVAREHQATEAKEELHVALTCLKAPEAVDEVTLDGLARTIAQLVKLDMAMIVVLDINTSNVQAEEHADQLSDVKTLRRLFAQQADRLCDAIDRHNPEGARSVPNALEMFEDHWEHGIDTSELQVTMPNLILDPLRRGMVPIVSSLAYTSAGQLVQVAAADIMAALTKHLTGKDKPDDVEAAHKPDEVSLDRIVVLDAVGGIPSKHRGHGAHVFINLEQEYDLVESELAEYAEAARDDDTHPRGPAFYDQHRDNLELVRRCLHLLPSSSSGLIVSPQEAASSSEAAKATLPPLGAGTRRQKNPLIHNLLTNKPVISSSLPTARLAPLEADTDKTPLTEASTVLRKGMPLTVIPAADRLLGWHRPAAGRTPLKLEKDPRVDLPRLVHLIEDSFRRKLNVGHYLQRVNSRIAGIIVAGQYEGGAVLTWEMPPGTNDPQRLVPYLDKFAVLQTSQGSSGVADIVFQAMVRSCFPNGVCWRSRKDNPVNKWYFERAAGSWQIPESNWTMFWTGKGVIENEQKWNDYVAVCSSIQTSWAKDGKKDD